MKQKTRSAAALLGMSLLAGGGIAATVTGLGSPAPAPATSAAAPAGSDAALAAAVHDLLARSQALHGRLVNTRHELRALDHRLHRQRTLAQHHAAAPVAVPPAPAAPAHVAAGAPPSVHTTTRASGSFVAPNVHTTTRASAAAGDDGEGGDD